MMKYNPYTIQQVFQYAFGVNPPIYTIKQSEVDYTPNFPNVQTATQEEVNKMSHLGTPIMFPISFPAGKYKMYGVDGVLKDDLTEVKSFDFPATTLVNFSRAKNIIRTDVLGGSGTVKEFFGFDDWQIRIRGVALSEPNATAREQIDSLLMFENVADSISLVLEDARKGFNTLFFDKEIYQLVIKDIDIKQIQGQPNMIPFEVTAMSDEPIELIL